MKLNRAARRAAASKYQPEQTINLSPTFVVIKVASGFKNKAKSFAAGSRPIGPISHAKTDMHQKSKQ